MDEIIKIKDIKILRNIRTEINDVSDLISSIRENGLLEPIGVSKIKNELILVYGHRRFLALKKLGRKVLVIGKEVLILDNIDNEDLLIINTVENIHRKDITPLELGKVCSDLREMGLSIGEISARIGNSRNNIIMYLKLLENVPKEFRSRISHVKGNTNKKGNISPTVASALSYYKERYKITKDDLNILFNIARKEELSSRDLRLIGIMLSEGKTLKECLELKKDFINKNVDFVVNEKEIKNLGIPFSVYIKKILKGEGKLNKNLFY